MPYAELPHCLTVPRDCIPVRLLLRGTLALGSGGKKINADALGTRFRGGGNEMWVLARCEAATIDW